MRAMRAGSIAGLVCALAACGGGGDVKEAPDSSPPIVDAAPDAAPPAPPLRNAVGLPDHDVAVQALQLIGANVSGAREVSCNQCHSLTRQQLRYWRALSDTSITACLTDLAVGSKESATQMVNCLRAKPASATSDFQTKKLGIYAAAAHLPWFAYTFERAYGPTAATELGRFQAIAGMPRDQVTPLTQPEFDVVAEWFARGLPEADALLPNDPAPSVCTAGVSAAVGAHTAALATTGWRAVNRQNQMAMFGCGAQTDPAQCLGAIPIASESPFATNWDVAGHGRLRLLADVQYSSSYWSRSSPDGRFIGHGVQDVAGSYILDLQRGGGDAPIPVAAQYDPNWFPDNSGFVFQGGQRNVCAQSVLTSNPTSVSMTEAGCSRINTIGLYEHVGRQLGDGDYFAIDSEFVSDDGGHSPTLGQPYASFGQGAMISFIPMVFTGTSYLARPQTRLPTPFEGDSVISPSASIVISRVEGPGEAQLGYVLRQVNATRVGAGYTVEIPEIARYCTGGGKPGFSYDERWIAYHRYVTPADATALGFTGPNDPAFAPYLTQGAANLYVMELSTGVSFRITNMHPGQYALFPHFRSDGWIYANVRDTVVGREYFIASDAALLAE